MATAFAFVPSPSHVYPDHPEQPKRFDLLAPRLDSFGAQRLEARPASRDEIARVHQPRLISALAEVCKQGPAVIDYAPTFVTQSSFEDALLASGAALGCTRAVMSRSAGNAFAIIRPPGHHAEPERPMGFCIFNNTAIAAREALAGGIPRVAIVDYDAHHGNGTQAAFLSEERIAYTSTHQWGIYPGTGWYQEAPQARKRIVNVPLPPGSGDQTYARIADEIWVPFVRSFKPGLILVSAGFDAHWNDPLTSLGLSTAGFYTLSKKLVDLAGEYCSGKIVFVLEGGYDPTNLANGAAAVFAALTDKPFVDPGDASPRRETDAGEMIEKVRAWHGF
ncbi:MAG TPA: histone deacetylase [Anaerolineales bacterium]|nr:histone deacetylase [Anaerolineales bacterium]